MKPQDFDLEHAFIYIYGKSKVHVYHSKSIKITGNDIQLYTKFSWNTCPKLYFELENQFTKQV